MITAVFSHREVLELQELCNWLDAQQQRGVYSDVILRELPQLKHWVSRAYKDKRREARLFYFQSGYGWKLQRHWRRRLQDIRLGR